MIADRTEMMRALKDAANEFFSDDPMHEILFSAAELLETDDDVISALRQKDRESAETMEKAGREIKRYIEREKMNLDLISECEVPQGTDLKQMDELGKRMQENVMQKALFCKAMTVNRYTDVAKACKVVQVKLSVVAGELPEEAKR